MRDKHMGLSLDNVAFRVSFILADMERLGRAYDTLTVQRDALLEALAHLTSVSEIVQADCDSSQGFEARNEWTPFFEAIRQARAALARVGVA